MSQTRTYLPKPKVADRYGKTIRTIDNWSNNPRLRFPRPIVINGRQHFPVDGLGGLDEWDAAQVKNDQRGAVAPIAEQVAA